MWLQKQMVKQKVISRPPEVWDILMCHRAVLWFLGVGCNGGICDRQFWDDFTLFGFHLSNYKVFNTPQPPPPRVIPVEPPRGCEASTAWWSLRMDIHWKLCSFSPLAMITLRCPHQNYIKRLWKFSILDLLEEVKRWWKTKFLKVHGLGKRIRSNDVEWVLLDIILLIFLRFETVCVRTFSGSRKQARLLGRHKANWLTYRSTIRGYLRNFACKHTCELLCNWNWQIM